MTGEEARSALTWVIQRFLIEHWDPMGLGATPAADDPETYAEPAREVLALLSDPEITPERIAHYLEWVERNSMHLQPREGAALAAAQRIVALPHPDADVAED